MPARSTMKRPGTTVILIALGIAGFLAALFMPHAPNRMNHAMAALLGIGLALVPKVRSWINRLFDRLNQATPRSRRQTFLLICFLMMGVLYYTAWYQGREFNPIWHDSLSYLQQMQIVATGRLWMPQHPVADFFETFHFLVKPVYTSIYFPGTAILFVAQVWLNLPPWQGPLIAMGLCAGLLYLVVNELLDNASAVIGVLILLGVRPFRQFSISVMSSGAMFLIVLLAIWSYLKWRKSKSPGWACAIGAFAGFGAITRPLDAFCVVLPIGLAILWDLRRLPAPRWIRTIVPGIVCAVPFLGLQLYYNHGVTGDAWTSPYRYYMDRYAPGINPGFHAHDASKVPQTNLPQKLIYHQAFNVPEIKQHTWDKVLQHWWIQRLPLAVRTLLASPFVLVFLFLGLYGLRRLDWVAVVAPIPLFILAYTFYPFVLSHYWLAVLAGIIFLLLRARHVLMDAFPQHREFVRVATATVLICLSFATLPQLGSGGLDDFARSGSLMTANFEQLPQTVQTPAVVLYRFHPDADLHFEPVYNIDVAWPDDAPIIRAHYMGARNIEIVHYYAQRQPNRHFYVVERTPKREGPNVANEPIGMNLFYLGTAADLAKRFSAPNPAPTTSPR